MAKRNLDLSSRKERTREIIPVKVFDIKEIKNHFQESLQDIENKFSFASELLETGKSEENPKRRKMSGGHKLYFLKVLLISICMKLLSWV